MFRFDCATPEPGVHAPEQPRFHSRGSLVAGYDTSLSDLPDRSLDGASETCKLPFSSMATMPNPLDDSLQDFQFPQREAAFFYGLFLRGHSADELRRDIAIPAPVLAKWDKETVHQPTLRPILERIVSYRRRVLAIFENLIGHDASTQRLQ